MCFPFFFLDLVNVYFCVVFRITFAKVQPCASDVKYFAIFFYFLNIISNICTRIFSYSYLNKIKYLCTRNGLPIPYQEEAIKREWGESPRLSRSCEPPLSTGANERTTEAMLWEGVRVWAASQKTCRNSFADGVIAVRLADWARMTATLTLYK